MTEQTDLKEWLQSLSAGDEVAMPLYPDSVFSHKTVFVERVTTTQVLVRGIHNARFSKKTGWEIGSRAKLRRAGRLYFDRIMPVTDAIRCEIRERALREAPEASNLPGLNAGVFAEKN